MKQPSKKSLEIRYYSALLLFFLLSTIHAQKQITGTVVDENNKPIVGATILEKEYVSNGSITDLDGNFTLKLKGESGIILVSYIGYKPQTVNALEQEKLTIVLNRGVGLLEVVVTARKKEESLQDVPISITALGAKTIERRNIIDIQDITLNTPSFSLDNFGGTKVRPAVRGLGSENTSPGQDFSTGVFYDGVYMSTNGMAALDIYDIERVETLKGPQGVLWGKNVIGGGINFVPTKPKFINNGKVSLTSGNYGLYGLSGFANISKSDKSAHRVAFNFRKNNGYADNLATGNGIDDLQRLSARYSAKFIPSDSWTIDFSADYTTDKSNGKNIQVFEGNRTGTTQNSPGYQYLLNTYGGNELGTREEFFEDNEFANRNVFGARLGFKYDINYNMSLSSVTAFREIEDSFFDTYNQFSTAQFEEAAIATNTTVTSLGIGDDTKADQLSTELRLESTMKKLNWTLGLFASREDGEQDFTFAVRRATPEEDTGTGEITATSSATNLVWSPVNRSNDFGIFGQTQIDLGTAFELNLGARYNSNKKEFKNVYGIPDTAVTIWEVVKEDSWSAFTWNASLKYKIGENSMVYASAAEGFKPGGFQVVTTAAVEAAEVPLDNETSLAYELGAKLDLSKNVRFNLAIFNTDYEGLQTVFLNQEGGAETSNIDNATITGFEAELITTLGKNLYGEVRYAYIKTDVDGLLSGEEKLDDLKLLRVPENEYTINLRYRKPTSNGNALEVSGLYSYRGEMFDNPQNVDTEIRPDVGLLDAYVSYETKKWDIKLWTKNLTNENYSLNSFGSQGAYAAVLGAPATYGITFTRYID